MSPMFKHIYYELGWADGKLICKNGMRMIYFHEYHPLTNHQYDDIYLRYGVFEDG